MQIAFLVEAVNTSGKRAALLRELSEDPMAVVPRLEMQMLADQQVRGGFTATAFKRLVKRRCFVGPYHTVPHVLIHKQYPTWLVGSKLPRPFSGGLGFYSTTLS